jgi:3-dehydroquinate dehydratase
MNHSKDIIDVESDIEKTKQKTVKLIEGAKDADFVDIELAKGTKTVREIVQKAIKDKDKKKIDELMNKINKL